jgi:uncharacterized membrane protein
VNDQFKYKELTIAAFLVITVSLLEWFIVNGQKASILLILMIFGGCMLKVGYIMIKCFRRIVSISHKEIPYHSFLGFIALNILLVVITFSLDYFFVFQLDPNSFSGLETATTPIERYFKLFYLSLLLFTNMGVANVVPVTIPAESLVMMEAIVSFVTLIFMLSDYVTLRESLNLIRSTKRRKTFRGSMHWYFRKKRKELR